MSKHISLCFILFCIAVLSDYSSPARNRRVDEVTVAVSTTNGQVRGYRDYTLYKQKLFYAFKGIPYAQPPIGNLRFKAPQPAHSWNGVLDADNYGNICIQSTGGSEDCLFLNVYTPNVSPRQKLPVLIDIHGGAFIAGSPNDHGPDFLFNQADLVVVSMNYRLGAFGFLTLGTAEFSGNMGLKDQQLAIKWVVDNIENFGGDSKQITLYGLSAGSVSVHNHIISESSQRLFQRAILASGTALNPWALTAENHLRRAILFAEQNGLATNDTTEIISFLENADAALFFAPNSVMLQFPLDDSLKSIANNWVPVLEPEGSVNPILQISPSKIFQSSFTTNIDTLFGVTSEESLLFINAQMNDPDLLRSLNESFRTQFPINSINQQYDFDSEQFLQISADTRRHYFGDQDIDIKTIPFYAGLRSDISFNYGIVRSVRFHAESSNAKTYFYRYSVDGVLNLAKAQTIAHTFGIVGATHGDDINYVFRSSRPEVMTIYSQLTVNSVERQTIDRLSKAYASFILTGTPTSDYIPVQQNSLNFIDYTNEGAILSRSPFEERITFWDNLLEHHELF